ncbi:unnamed protein product [Jaminaea pallidilutea]
MAPRRKNQSIKSTGATSSKASPLPDWVKSGGKPPGPGPPTQQPASQSKKAVAGNGEQKGSAVPAPPPRPPPLFPIGTKTPQNLLNERVQKLFKDWERPSYHPRPLSPNSGASDEEDAAQQHKYGPKDEAENQSQPWTCSVTLSRPNPKDRSTKETVRIAPDEEDTRQRFTDGECNSKEMARHWGATFALFRLFSTQSLGLMLPTQFRDYWSSLERWKQSLPAERQATLFATDPFAAQAQIRADKEARAAKRERDRQVADGSARPGSSAEDRLPKRWKEAKEVRMAKSMREWVEDVVKRASIELPDTLEADHSLTDSDSASSSPTIDKQKLATRLSSLGFKPGQKDVALDWLVRARHRLSQETSASSKDPLLHTIAAQTDEDALITYLVLYVPEEDLPIRFRASTSSEGFVTSGIAKGKEDNLRLQWALDRLTKCAGFPKAAAQAALTSCTQTCAGASIGQVEIQALRTLMTQLSGFSEGSRGANAVTDSPSNEMRKEELTVIQSILGEDRVLPISTDERPLGFTGALHECFDVAIAGPSRAHAEGEMNEKVWGEEEIRLRVLWKVDLYPSEDQAQSWPTFYVASPASATSGERLPSFLRLALTQRLLKCFHSSPEWVQMLKDGQGGLIMLAVEELEACWKEYAMRSSNIRFEDVMSGFVRSRHTESQTPTPAPSTAPKQKNRSVTAPRPLRRDQELDAQLLHRRRDFASSTQGSQLLSGRSTLPIAHHYENIVASLRSHRLMLLTGSTGSGKTTQLPQFILDCEIDANRGSACKIIVTQPRRVSAMSIAERVAYERGEAIGGTVGWAVRGERKVGRDNRILFTTTGLLLRRLQTEPDLASISHLLIDEIHERSLDSDLLLLEISSLLKANPSLKVVLMSATLQKEKFEAYFSTRIPGQESSKAIGTVDVEGRIHPVDDFYLEDVIRQTAYRPSAQSASPWGNKERVGPLKGLREYCVANGYSEGEITALEVLERERQGQAVGSLDYSLVGRAVQHVVDREQTKEQQSGDSHLGAILVFMSGVGEIRQAVEAIRASLPPAARIEVMPLHSNLSSEEQQRVFKPTPRGVRKIVVATNVAEASITIDGVTAVIDSGRVKETMYDPESGLTRLVEQYTSRASAMQRRGRAGRTRHGECWKLFTRTLEQRKMPQDGQPEMTRVPLESVVLHVLSMGKSDPTAYLSGALDPPSLVSISSAILNLHEAGAIRQRSGGSAISTTALGRHLANLPLDLRLGKLLILGCLFQCLEPLLTVAAIMSCKPMFATPFEKRDELAAIRSKRAQGIKSDLLTDAAIFDDWAAMRKSRTSSAASAKEYAAEHQLAASSLRDIAMTRSDLLSNLQEIGLAPRDYSSYSTHNLDKYSTSHALLRALLAASLWPNVIRIALPEAKYAESSSGTVARDTEAKQVKLFDVSSPGRVFLHPSSVLFSSKRFDSSHLAVFKKSSTGSDSASANAKVYLRDATEVPMYSLLLFCGRLKIHHMQGGISIASATQAANSSEAAHGDEEGSVRLRAPARIGVLSGQLRRLLDAHLADAFEGNTDQTSGPATQELMTVLRALLERDGMSADSL